MEQKQNCFIKSQTGSGKTLSYLIPLINRLMNNPDKINRKSGLFAMILCPTWELSIQIYNTLLQLTKVCVNIVPGLLIGGEQIKKEKEKIRKGINIIIGTPGKILYHFKNSQNLRFDLLNCLVFEEADQILEVGYEKDLNEIIRTCSGNTIQY